MMRQAPEHATSRFDLAQSHLYRLTLFMAMVVLALVASARSSEAEQKVFQVSSPANRGELIKVFNAVRDLEAAAGAEEETFEVAQRISPNRVLVYKTRIETHVIGDSLSAAGGGGRVVATERLVRAGTTLYCLETHAPTSQVDGEKIILKVEPEGEGIFEYTSTLGAKLSVRVIKQAPAEAKPEFTRKLFSERLQAGQTWTLKNFQQIPCHNCRGKGELGSLQKHAPCPACQGLGHSSIDLLVKW